MEELSLHIEYLLFRHDCVIVPGLGAFIAGRQGAVIDHTSGFVTPPTRDISFNREVQTDDGLLAHSVARKATISFEEGRERMLAAISEIKAHLLGEGEVTLGHVGTLRMGDEATLEFHPYRRGEAHALSMGYGTVALKKDTQEESSIITSAQATPKYQEAQISNTKTEKGENNPEVITTPKDNTVAEDSIETENEETTQGIKHKSPYYIIRIRKTYAHIAACLLLLVMMCVSLYLPSSNRLDSDKAYASVVPVDAISRTMQSSTDTEKEAPASISIKESTDGKVHEEHEALPSTEVVKQEDTLLPYYLIVATFRTVTEADKYIALSSEEGLVRVDGNKLHRVAIAADSKKENLQALLNSPEFKKKHAGAWIWKSK